MRCIKMIFKNEKFTLNSFTDLEKSDSGSSPGGYKRSSIWVTYSLKSPCMITILFALAREMLSNISCRSRVTAGSDNMGIKSL